MKRILSLRIPESTSGKLRGPQTIFWESLVCEWMWKLETPYEGVLITLKIYTLGIRKGLLATFLMVWWLRIHLPQQGMWVWSLVRNYDPMCHRATKPTHHNHWGCSPQLESLHAPTKIPHAAAKTWHSHKYMQTHIKRKGSSFTGLWFVCREAFCVSNIAPSRYLGHVRERVSCPDFYFLCPEN